MAYRMTVEGERPVYIPTTICWLPVPLAPKRQKRTFIDVGHFVFLRETLINHERVWNMIEISVPPLLHKKFHTINVSELIKDTPENQHYLGVATWFMLWNESLGLEYLSLIHKKHSQYANTTKNRQYPKLLSKWRNKIDALVKCFRTVYELTCAPTLEDNCTKAIEFILEPCILIQLPWKPVLFHQWLLASLIEVLIFERESLEFRHWPLHDKIFTCAVELLTLVRKLKERITLGLVILFHQVALYPKYNTSLADVILDDVVLPSLATLQFLITGKAHQVMKSMKKIAWSTNSNLGATKCGSFMPFGGFYMDADLTGFYVSQCYNYDIWNSTDVPEPFPSNKIKIPNIARRLNANASILPETSDLALVMKPYNLEEKNFYEFLEHNQKSQYIKLNAQERVNLAVKTMIELVVEPGRVLFVTPKMVMEKFQTPEGKKHAGEIFNRQIMKEASHLAIGYSMMYWQAYVSLIGCEKENTVIGRVVALGLEILEREQVIRLTNCAVALFQQCPIAIKLSPAAPMSIQSMTQLIEEVKIKRDKQDRASLWSQLPVDWKKPVNLGEILPKLDSGIEVITKSFENRLGRVVYNVAQESFKVIEKGGEAFPDWQVVQYVLPSIVGSFVKKSESKTLDTDINQTNYLKLIHHLVQFYEKKYKVWKTECKPRQMIDTSRDGKENDKLLVEEMRFLSLAFDEKVHPLLSFYTDSGQIAEAECFPGFDMLRDSLIHFPNTFLTSENPLFPDIQHIIKPWQERSFYFLKYLHQLCVQVWKPHTPGVPIPTCPKLGELYFAEAIIFELIAAFRVTKLYATKDRTIASQKLILSICEAICDMEKWKYILIKLALDPKRYSIAKTLDFVEQKINLMLKLYRELKIYRQNIGNVNFKLLDQLSDNPPELQIAVSYYIDGNFIALDKMLTIFHSGGGALKKVPDKPKRQCRSCSKYEGKREKFIVCQQCVDDKYPDVNYCCGKKCQDAWWKEEHMAEHLEFDLGLSDFSHLNLDDDPPQ